MTPEPDAECGAHTREAAVRAYGRDFVRHANADHQTELRRFVATRRGIALGLIAGVRWTRIDELGGHLWWVDEHGAHAETLSFGRPARTPRELADLLRRELRGAHHRQESR